MESVIVVRRSSFSPFFTLSILLPLSLLTHSIRPTPQVGQNLNSFARSIGDMGDRFAMELGFMSR
jgi:hypothetical protein